MTNNHADLSRTNLPHVTLQRRRIGTTGVFTCMLSVSGSDTLLMTGESVLILKFLRWFSVSVLICRLEMGYSLTVTTYVDGMEDFCFSRVGQTASATLNNVLNFFTKKNNHSRQFWMAHKPLLRYRLYVRIRQLEVNSRTNQGAL